MDTQIFNLAYLGFANTLSTQLVKIIEAVVPTIICWLKRLFSYFYTKWKGKIHEIVITVNATSSDEKTNNNSMLMDALLALDGDATSFKLECVHSTDRHDTEYDAKLASTLKCKSDKTFTFENVTFTYQEHYKTVGDEKTKQNVLDRQTLTLQSRMAKNEFNAWINDMYRNYVRRICSRKRELTFYMHTTSKDRCAPEFSATHLKNEATLDSIFFPERDMLLKTLHHFMNGTGKYAIPGVQRKIVILMHGKPGCGKTTLIKAISNHLSRSIMSCNLGLFTTEYQLRCVLQSKYIYKTQSHKVDVVLPSQRIIVFEEIDTAGSCVWDREIVRQRVREANIADVMGRDRYARPWMKAIRQHHEVISNNERERLMEEKNRLLMEHKKEEQRVRLQVLIDKGDITMDEMETRLNRFIRQSEIEAQLEVPKSSISSTKVPIDEVDEKGINLGHILTALDGIHELYDHVIIMTTNDISILDKALYRKGRVTMILEMKEMEQGDIFKTMEFYYKHIFDNILDTDLNMMKEISAVMHQHVTLSDLHAMMDSYTLKEIYELHVIKKSQ